jgi:glycosyltransferase 2 family protein
MSAVHAGRGGATPRTAWRWAGVAAAAVTLAVLVWRLGTSPFLEGVRAVDGRALTAAAGLGALTTVCCAWRWKIVARGLGVDLPLGAAVAAYYRSQFLNLTVPGGIVGDVHRGISHGRDVSDVGRGLRAVAWERLAGQVVQAVLTIFVLLTLPSPVRAAMPPVAILLVVAVVVVVLVARRWPGRAGSRWARIRGAVARDIREGLLTGRAWLGIAVASALVVAGQAVVFMIAAGAAGTTVSPTTMLPLALLAMLAMVLPSVAGLGPREGVTASVFAAAGLGAERGVATAVAYGVMVLVASLPGAAVLVASLFRGARPAAGREAPLADRTPVAVRSDGAADA